MLYAVIDTNVLVSALLSFNSIPGLIAEQALTGNIIPVLHEDILNEYRGVLSREKFDFPMHLVNRLIDGFVGRSVFTEPAYVDVEISLPDVKDEIFYAVALNARKYVDSSTFIITGNMKHFPDVPFAVTPREALNFLLLRRMN
ncbi:MAG: PIN domain-containing protein [Synergistaceae bacterium]|nr:PIN domain-containing protein [Synergistaceae bacterium]